MKIFTLYQDAAQNGSSLIGLIVKCTHLEYNLKHKHDKIKLQRTH